MPDLVKVPDIEGLRWLYDKFHRINFTLRAEHTFFFSYSCYYRI